MIGAIIAASCGVFLGMSCSFMPLWLMTRRTN